MSKLKPTTPWSTILKPSTSMPKNLNKGRGIFLGYTKGMFIKVVTKGNSTASTYTTDFWEVDDLYMSDREQIAELRGRIAESDEPIDVGQYRNEMDTIQKRMATS